MAKRNTNRPVHTIRAGRLSVSIWLNTGQNGGYYQVSPQRAFREDGEIRNSGSFAESDVPLLNRLLEEAFNWMRSNPLDRESSAA